jgi:hypothetical protein
MPFDFYRHQFPEPTSDRMSTAGIQYSPSFLVTLPSQLVQSLVKRSNAGLCQINRLRKHHNEIRPLITNHSPGNAVNADIAVNGKRRTPNAKRIPATTNQRRYLSYSYQSLITSHQSPFPAFPAFSALSALTHCAPVEVA